MSGERTYRREDVVESRRRWAEGEFDAAWQPYRTLAAGRGFIHPPAGSRHDSIDDEPPSQRAIVWRAIEDTPTLLRDAIRRSRNWGEVVRLLIAELDRRREDAGLAERDAAWEREQLPTRRQAAEHIASIFGRLRS